MNTSMVEPVPAAESSARSSRTLAVLKYLMVLLSIGGLFVSVRALQIHNMDPSQTPPCAVTEHFDCGTVQHSRYSFFPPKTLDEAPGKFHIPVATIGILGYLAIALFALLGRFNIVLEMTRIGFFCAAMLSYIEAYVIQMWCIYCLWSQGIMAALLLISVAAVLLRRRQRAQSMRRVLTEAIE